MKAISSFHKALGVGIIAMIATFFGSTVQGSAASCNAGSDFAGAVQWLDAGGFNFTTNGMVGTPPGYSRPAPPAMGAAISGDVATAMAAAWSAAPQSIQVMLCNLAKGTDPSGTPITSGVFVDKNDSAPFGWSFWEVPEQKDGSGRYIAVNLKLWGGTANVDLQSIETLILTHLLGSNAKPDLVGEIMVQPVTPNSETYSSSGNNPASYQYSHGPTNYALMAILARELALMIYHDKVGVQKDVSGSEPSAPLSICGTSPNQIPFSSYSWTTDSLFSELGHIHMLGEEVNPAYMFAKNFGSDYLPSQLRKSPRQFPNPSADRLRTIYTGKSNSPEWAGLLALTTPYDDFAETFRLVAETNVIKSLSFVVGGKPAAVDLIANSLAQNSILAQKVGCINQQLNKGNWSTP